MENSRAKQTYLPSKTNLHCEHSFIINLAPLMGMVASDLNLILSAEITW